MNKILAISTSYPLRPGNVSGIFVHTLYRAMTDSWSIEVLCPDDNRPSGGVIDGVTVTPVRYMLKRMQVLGGAGGILPSLKANPLKLLLLPSLLASLLMHALIKARRADVIHGNWATCGIIAGVAGKMLGKETVMTLRGSDVAGSRNSRVLRWQLQLALDAVDAVVCVSEAMRKDLVNAYPQHARKISVCHNGISADFFSSSRRVKQQGSPLQLLAVGGLVSVKGFDLLLKAISGLGEDAPLFLTIIGEGPERNALNAQIRQYGLESKVALKGEVTHSCMPQIMAEADVFVLSSRAEGRPNVVAEAVASSLPVICSNLPGIQGLVEAGRNGWLVESGNVAAFADAIRAALDRTADLPAMGAYGREKIHDNSSWAACAACYGALFNRLTGGGIR